MNMRRFLRVVGVLILHVTASAGLLFCLCYGATGRPLLAILAGIVCLVSIIGFRKLEPDERTSSK